MEQLKDVFCYLSGLCFAAGEENSVRQQHEQQWKLCSLLGRPDMHGHHEGTPPCLTPSCLVYACFLLIINEKPHRLQLCSLYAALLIAFICWMHLILPQVKMRTSLRKRIRAKGDSAFLPLTLNHSSIDSMQLHLGAEGFFFGFVWLFATFDSDIILQFQFWLGIVWCLYRPWTFWSYLTSKK